MSGVAIGNERGFVVSKIVRRKSVASRKGRFGPRHALAKEVAREVCGYANYEKRILEFLRNGFDRKALRLAKRKIGTHQRAKRKREEMSRVLQQQNIKK